MKKIWKSYKISLLIILFSLAVGIAPIISVLVSSIIAGIGGCQLNEGVLNPCQIGPFELSNVLYTMFVAGWYIFLSIPLAFLGLIIGLISFFIQASKNRGK